MTPLQAVVAKRIRREGPISLADYIALALLHPEHGYYVTRDPLGQGGDFVTAPEVSQMFGELIGLWCADYWDRMGRPARFSLVELGPGRGTLMADALRAAAALPGFVDAAELVLIEASPALRQVQQDRLGPYQPQWLTSLSELKPQVILLIANEFFDALPVRQFTRRDAHWLETMVGLSDDGDELCLTISREPARHTPLLDRLYPQAQDGEVAELPAAAISMVHEIALRLCQAQGDGAPAQGAALIVDYGYYPSRAHATLQAVQAHRQHGLLETPGEADLTAHVNFQALLTAAAEGGARTWGPLNQGSFLTALGLEERAAALAARASAAQQQAIAAAKHRLTDPGQMGVLFKVAALTAKATPAPAGFAE